MGLRAAAGAHGGGQFGEQGVGFWPVYAGVGDALAVDEGLAGDELLRAGDQIALDHDAHNPSIAALTARACDLLRDIVTDDGLAAVILAAVGVGEVDHDARFDAGLLHLLGGFGDAIGGVVDRAAASAQDDVAIGISLSDEDGRLAGFGEAEEGMGVGGGEDGVDGDLYVAGGAVLESHRAGDAADQLAVDLALGGARADGPPTDEAGDVLGRDHVEEFGSGGDAHLGQVEEQMAGEAQAVVDFEGLIEMGVVDEALPSDGGAGLLEVDAHDDAQVGGKLFDGGVEEGGVLAGGLGVVNGAGADEGEQARVAAVEDGGDFVAGVEDGSRGGFGYRALFLKEYRGKDNLGPLDAEIFSGVEHGGVLVMNLSAASGKACQLTHPSRNSYKKQVLRLRYAPLRMTAARVGDPDVSKGWGNVTASEVPLIRVYHN